MAALNSYNYGVLPEQAQEDALHATRLLNIEERPFHRLTRALLSQDSLLKQLPRQLPSPPPEGDDAHEEQDIRRSEAIKRSKFRDEVLLDFAALESSIVRIQLIQSSNQRERERYAAEKAKILETAQAVRSSTVQLRGQLEEAQRVLQLRKGYDELAGKILDDKKLKSRDESRADIEKLEKEIEDLQSESAEYEVTWAGRREQFDKVVAEGEGMLRLIRGIKDEPEQERDEEMEGADESGEGTKGQSSRLGTPGPEGRTPMRDVEGATPLHESGDADGGGGGATPARPSNRLLEIDDATRSSSQAASPAVKAADPQTDVDMAGSSAEDALVKDSTDMEAAADQVAEPAEAVPEKMDET